MEARETFIAGQPLRTYKEKGTLASAQLCTAGEAERVFLPCARHGGNGPEREPKLFKVPDQSQYDQAEELLNLLGCQKLIDRYCNQLSGGELQMVMIARALISRPQLLVLDEPESNLDMKNQLRILDAIERASREMNTACLINTHFPNHALNISDQTLMLGLGQKKLFGATKDLLNEENIERFFSVRSKIVSFSSRWPGTPDHFSLPYCFSQQRRWNNMIPFSYDFMQPMYPLLIQQFLDDYNLSAGVALDIGTGPGNLAVELAKVTAMDLIFGGH